MLQASLNLSVSTLVPEHVGLLHPSSSGVDKVVDEHGVDRSYATGVSADQHGPEIGTARKNAIQQEGSIHSLRSLWNVWSQNGVIWSLIISHNIPGHKRCLVTNMVTMVK